MNAPIEERHRLAAEAHGEDLAEAWSMEDEMVIVAQAIADCERETRQDTIRDACAWIIANGPQIPNAARFLEDMNRKAEST